MRLPLEPRHTALLAAFTAIADQYWPGFQDVQAADVPPDAIAAVRVALLRSVVESEYGTGESAAAELRFRLARRQTESDPAGVELELALLRVGSTFDPGVRLGVLRLPLLDPLLEDLASLDPAQLDPGLLREIERFAEHLESPGLRDERDAYHRRPALIDALHRARPGRLSPLAFDPGDDYGATMRALVGTDHDLASEFVPLYPLICRASTVLPDARWTAAAAAVHATPSAALRAAVIRSIRPALDIDPPPNAGLPDGAGALRITNQRLLRGLLWLAARFDPVWAADAFADIGIFYGTSGRKDNTARDAAVAGTCASLLGEIATPAAAAALARMEARITNRPVGKQIAAAVERLVAAGPATETDVDLPLPTFDLDPDGRRSVAVGSWTARIEVSPDGAVDVHWQGPDGAMSSKPPLSVRNERPGEVAAVADLVRRIRATIVEERSRIELDFALARERRVEAWRTRWLQHPIGRVFGRRLIWEFVAEDAGIVGLPGGDEIEDVAARRIDIDPARMTRVRLWHPVESDAGVVEAWRRRIVTGRVVQPVKQAFRETYAPSSDATDAMLDRRFAGRALDQGHLRALMRARRWTGPVLGPWDTGNQATVARELTGTGWRAELDIEASGQAGPADAVTVVRSGSVRFLHGAGRSAKPATIDRVPARIRSEVLRDVDLFTAVADITRRSPRHDDPDDASTVVANRASILRAVIPTLTIGHRLSVFGRWLRVEGDAGAFAISLVDGSALSLADESAVDLAPRRADHRPSAYLPVSDDATLNAIVDLAHRLVAANLD